MNKIFIIFLFFCQPFLIYSQNYLKSFREISEFSNNGDTIYISAQTNDLGKELWISLGTKETTHIVKDIKKGSYSSNPQYLTKYKNHMYFTASHEKLGNELWKTDGTEVGTVIVKDIHPGIGLYSSSAPRNLVLFNDKLFFTATDDYDDDLWYTDGTEEGTIKYYDYDYSDLENFIVCGDYLFFINNNKLWKTNGTENGTYQIDANDSSHKDFLIDFNGKLMFLAWEYNTSNKQIYLLDSETDEFTLIKEFEYPSYGTLEIDNFKFVKDQVFFSVRWVNENGESADELWVSKGTLETTDLVTSFSWDRHSSGSESNCFISYNDLLFFRGPNEYSHSLMKSDGSSSGTQIVTDISLLSEQHMCVSNHLLYIPTRDAIYVSDGTTENTSPIIEARFPSRFLNANGLLYYQADNADNEESIWNIEPKAEFKISRSTSELENGSLIVFGKQNTGTSKSFRYKISNLGNKNLLISDIYINGKDFFFTSVPEVIKPDEYEYFELVFFPSSQGVKNNQLRIRNNDYDEFDFIINLNGEAEGELNTPNAINQDANMINHQSYQFENDSLKLSSTIVDEQNDPASKIGDFQVVFNGNENYTFELIETEYSTDNDKFFIFENSLYSKYSFDYELQNNYIISIQATHESFKNLIRNFVIQVNDLNEDYSNIECNNKFKKLAFGLNDVEQVNNHFFAVGEFGTIIKSTDNGESWEEINSGTYGDLYDLQFTSDQIGYIMASYGNILKTENGGLNWFPIQFPESGYPYIRNMHFINDDIGFCVGENEFMKTLDGGKTWEFKSLGFSDHYTSVFFIDQYHGYVSGSSNELMRTADGGENWEEIDMSDLGFNVGLSNPYFTDFNTGFLTTSYGRLIKSTDGFNTWIEDDTISGASKIVLIDDDRWFVCGGSVLHWLYETKDGGSTFTQKDFEKYGQVKGIAFSENQQNACLVGNSSSYSAPRGTNVKTSSDGGISWNEKSYIYPDIDFNIIHFINDEIGFVFGGDNYHTGGYKTINGGLTWENISIPSDEKVKDAHIFSEDSIIIFAYEPYLTIDGGNNWTELQNFEQNDMFSFINAHKIFRLDNSYGDVYVTHDFGETWDLFLDHENEIRTIFFLNNNLGFAIEFNAIYTTHDGGLTWIEFQTEEFLLIKSILQLDDQSIILGGYEGQFLKTNNLGIDWEIIPNDINNSISKFLIGDNHELVALASDIYISFDDGDNWETYIRFSEDAQDMQFINNDELVACGKSGLLGIYQEEKKPSQAGYLFGDELQCDTYVAHLETPSNYSYYNWEITGNPQISFTENKVDIQWPEPGNYTVEVTPYNECGEGMFRNTTIIVDELPNPIIQGLDSVNIYQPWVAYHSNEHPDSRITWNISGDYETQSMEDDEIHVKWHSIQNTQVQLIHTNYESNCRAFDTHRVQIYQSIDSQENFISLQLQPNPTHSELFIIGPKENSHKDLKIYDISGKLLLSQDNYKSNHINLGNYSNGIYFINISLNGGESFSKFKIVKN